MTTTPAPPDDLDAVLAEASHYHHGHLRLRAERNALIRRAHRDGASMMRIATSVGLGSATSVKRIIDAGDDQ